MGGEVSHMPQEAVQPIPTSFSFPAQQNAPVLRGRVGGGGGRWGGRRQVWFRPKCRREVGAQDRAHLHRALPPLLLLLLLLRHRTPLPVHGERVEESAL